MCMCVCVCCLTGEALHRALSASLVARKDSTRSEWCGKNREKVMHGILKVSLM